LSPVGTVFRFQFGRQLLTRISLERCVSGSPTQPGPSPQAPRKGNLLVRPETPSPVSRPSRRFTFARPNLLRRFCDELERRFVHPFALFPSPSASDLIRRDDFCLARPPRLPVELGRPALVDQRCFRSSSATHYFVYEHPCLVGSRFILEVRTLRVTFRASDRFPVSAFAPLGLFRTGPRKGRGFRRFTTPFESLRWICRH